MPVHAPASLTIEDLFLEDSLRLKLIGGANGISNEVQWVHIIELEDPTPFLEGGELLLATGLALKEDARAQRAYVRRLAKHGVAGLGVGIGVAFPEVPTAMAREADRLGFPLLSVPLKIPFIAITKFAFAKLGEHRLQMFTSALSMQEALMRAALDGSGIEVIVGLLCHHLRCSVTLVDEGGHILHERRWRNRTHAAENATELAVESREASATMRVSRVDEPFNEYEMLVLHYGQMALAVELARRGAANAARLQLGGDLLEDMAEQRLDERQTARRLTAFGLDADRAFTPILVGLEDVAGASRLTAAVSRKLEPQKVHYLASTRQMTTTMIVALASDDEALSFGQALVDEEMVARVCIGRRAYAPSLGRSLLETKAVFACTTKPLVTYRDLGGLALLLSLPEPALRAFVDAALGTLTGDKRLLDSLTALIEFDGRWTDAASYLGVHRHTLRYRMNRVSERIGRDLDSPEDRKELWLAIRANALLNGAPGGSIMERDPSTRGEYRGRRDPRQQDISGGRT